MPSAVPTGLVTFSEPALQQKSSKVSQAFNLVQQTDLGSVEAWPDLSAWARWAESFAVSGVASPRLGYEPKGVRAGSGQGAKCLPGRQNHRLQRP